MFAPCDLIAATNDRTTAPHHTTPHGDRTTAPHHYTRNTAHGTRRNPKRTTLQPRFCARHKLPGMMDVRNRRCEEPGCTRQPSYGKEGQRRQFCFTHKRPGDVDVKSTRHVYTHLRAPCFFLAAELPIRLTRMRDVRWFDGTTACVFCLLSCVLVLDYHRLMHEPPPIASGVALVSTSSQAWRRMRIVVSLTNSQRRRMTTERGSETTERSSVTLGGASSVVVERASENITVMATMDLFEDCFSFNTSAVRVTNHIKLSESFFFLPRQHTAISGCGAVSVVAQRTGKITVMMATMNLFRDCFKFNIFAVRVTNHIEVRSETLVDGVAARHHSFPRPTRERLGYGLPARFGQPVRARVACFLFCH